MAAEAEKLGASALLILPPYYQNACFDGLLSYLKGIGQATSLPLILYTRDWFNLNPEEAQRVADEVPNLWGWKDGQGELRSLQRIRSRLGERFTWIGGVGDDHVSGYYGIGIRRFTSSISCVAPKLSIALHNAGASREEAELAELTDRFVLPLYNLRTRRKGYEVSAMKALLELRGYAGGPSRPPLVDVNETEREELAAWFGSLPSQPTFLPAGRIVRDDERRDGRSHPCGTGAQGGGEDAWQRSDHAAILESEYDQDQGTDAALVSRELSLQPTTNNSS